MKTNRALFQYDRSTEGCLSGILNNFNNIGQQYNPETNCFEWQFDEESHKLLRADAEGASTSILVGLNSLGQFLFTAELAEGLPPAVTSGLGYLLYELSSAVLRLQEVQMNPCATVRESPPEGS